MGFFGTGHGSVGLGGAKKKKNYMNRMIHPLGFANIRIFLPEISKFGYIKKYRYRFHLDT